MRDRLERIRAVTGRARWRAAARAMERRGAFPAEAGGARTIAADSEARELGDVGLPREEARRSAAKQGMASAARLTREGGDGGGQDEGCGVERTGPAQIEPAVDAFLPRALQS